MIVIALIVEHLCQIFDIYGKFDFPILTIKFL